LPTTNCLNHGTYFNACPHSHVTQATTSLMFLSSTYFILDQRLLIRSHNALERRVDLLIYHAKAATVVLPSTLLLIWLAFMKYSGRQIIGTLGSTT
jgi:hypothetical protein